MEVTSSTLTVEATCPIVQVPPAPEAGFAPILPSAVKVFAFSTRESDVIVSHAFRGGPLGNRLLRLRKSCHRQVAANGFPVLNAKVQVRFLFTTICNSVSQEQRRNESSTSNDTSLEA